MRTSEHHLDPRAPLVLDTRDLPRSPGAMRAVDRVVPAPEDLGLELIGVPAGADLALDLRMESVSEGVLVSGTVTGAARGRVRPLPARDQRHVGRDVQELYAYAAQHHGRDDRRGRGRPDAGRPDRPGAGAAGRGGARAADQPAVPRGLPRAVPRVRGARGTTCRRTTATGRSTRAGPRLEQFDRTSRRSHRDREE